MTENKDNYIVYEYKSSTDVRSKVAMEALNYVYSIAYPKPEKTFEEMCHDLNTEKEKENGGNNWRKMYGKYQWPIDFFYVPDNVMCEVWKSYKEAYRFENFWKEYVGFLSDCLFKKGGLREVYCPTEWSNGKDVRHCVDQPLLKDIIGDENAEKAKDLIDGYLNTYKFDSVPELSLCGAYLSTPTCNRETVKEAWKEAFNIDVEIPEDSKWIDIYDYADKMDEWELDENEED